MIKKNLWLILIVFLLTGCQATVNVSIEDNDIEESVEIVASNNSEYSEIKNWSGFPLETNYDDYMDNYLSVDDTRKAGIDYYDVINNDQNLTTNVSSSFNFSEYENSSIVKNCFEYFNILEDGDIVTFSTSKGLRCNFNNFDIVVNTPYLVVTNNASSVDEATNTFTWSVNENASSDFGVFMEIDFSQRYDDSNDNSFNDMNNETFSIGSYVVVGFIIVLSVIVTIFILILLKKKKQSSDL